MIDPNLHLWRAVLLKALSDDDAPAWIRSPDGETVCTLAGLDHEAVVMRIDRRINRKGRRAA